MAYCYYQTLPRYFLIGLNHRNPIFSRKFDLLMQCRWYYPYSMNPRSSQIHYVQRKCINHNEIYLNFVSFSHHQELYLPLKRYSFPLNPTSYVSYLYRSLGFNPNPLYRTGYMIYALLHWSIITLLTKKPPILEVTTKASSCGCDIPSKFASTKVMGYEFFLNFFLGRSITFVLGRVTTLNISLWRLILTPMEFAWTTSIIPKGGESVSTQLPDPWPVLNPPYLTTDSFKCPAFTSYSKWSFNTRHCSVVWPFYLW